MMLNIPESTTLVFSAVEYAAELERERAAALTTANATIAQQQDALKAMETRHQATLTENERVYAEALKVVEQQGLKLKEAARVEAEKDAEITRLKQQLADALKGTPPVVIPPVTPVPAPEPNDDPVYPFCAGYFENPLPDDSVNDQAQAKAHADAIIPSMVFAAEHCPAMRDFIWYGNLEDFKWNAVIRLIHDLKKRWWLSPAQAYYGKPEFTRHLQAAHDAGCYGVIIDDAHNVKDYIVPLLDAVNRYMPNAPVICSFGAEFDDSAYPRERYYDMRQWFIRAQEKESVYFPKWETSQDAALYAAHVYRDKKGFQHTPERIRSMFETALPFVEGVAFYSLLNKQTNIMAEHINTKKKNPAALTVFDVIQECSAVYQKTYEARRTIA